MTTYQRLQRARAEIAEYLPNFATGGTLFGDKVFELHDVEICNEVYHLGGNMYGDRWGNKWSVRTCPPIEEVIVKPDHRSLLLHNIQTKGSIL